MAPDTYAPYTNNPTGLNKYIHKDSWWYTLNLTQSSLPRFDFAKFKRRFSEVTDKYAEVAVTQSGQVGPCTL